MNRFLTGIILVLVAIIFLQRSCGNNTSSSSGPEIPAPGIDTVYLTKDSLIVKTVTLVKRDTTRRKGDVEFIPDTNYAALKQQYESLAKSYATRNIYSDTLRLDSLGHIVVHDTVQYNVLKQRTTEISYKIPVITKTYVQPPRRQLYVGGGLSMNTNLEEPHLQLGLLYKNKKDQVYGIYTLLDGTSAPQVGISSYWKISLKKK